MRDAVKGKGEKVGEETQTQALFLRPRPTGAQRHHTECKEHGAMSVKFWVLILIINSFIEGSWEIKSSKLKF